jgi:hypothetical protein
MPTYTFRNKHSQEVSEHFLKISELDEFKKSNPDLEPIITQSGLIRSYNQKPDVGFREVLKNIKKSNRRSNINTFE